MELCYKTAAVEWTEALPVGNGRAGAMVYGGAVTEKIELNESTLWSGYPVQSYRGLTYETYLHAKECVKQGKNKQAMDALEEELLQAEDEQMYLPFGSLQLTFSGDRDITDYRRALNLDQGVISVSYRNHGCAYEHTVFASYPRECIVYRIEAEEEFDIHISMESKLQATVSYEKEKIILSGQCPGRSGLTIGGSANASHQYSSKDEEKGMRFEGRVRLQTDAKRTEATSLGITCSKARAVTLFVMMRTSFNGYQKHPFLEGADEKKALDADEKRIAEAASYESLRQEHIEDYRELFDRVHLSLGDREPQELYPLEELSNMGEGGPCLSFRRYLTMGVIF